MKTRIMSKRLFIPALLALWLAATGCTTITFLVKSLPPEMESNEGDRIGFVNRFDYRSNALIKEKHDTAYFEGVSAFAKTLTGDTLPDRRISFFLSEDTTITSSPSLTLNKALPEEAIRAFCYRDQATHLLTLDSLKLGFDWETVREENEDGSVSKTKYIYLQSSYYLSLYDSTGAMVRKTLLDRSMEYAARPTLSGLITIVPNLAKARGKIAALARESAIQYTDMFYPSEEKTMKILHDGKPFKESNTLIKRDEFEAAIELLTPLTHSSKKSLARKARQNLDVTRELLDNKNMQEKP